jgi:hypothetical protein
LETNYTDNDEIADEEESIEVEEGEEFRQRRGRGRPFKPR